MKNLIIAIFAATTLLSVADTASAAECKKASTSTTYGGRCYDAFSKGKNPKLTAANVATWSAEHDRLSNFVAKGRKLSRVQCLRFQWLDRRWEQAYRAGMAPRPNWYGTTPNRMRHLGV